jgi:ribosomal protein L11 methylase PrmA
MNKKDLVLKIQNNFIDYMHNLAKHTCKIERAKISISLNEPNALPSENSFVFSTSVESFSLKGLQYIDYFSSILCNLFTYNKSPMIFLDLSSTSGVLGILASAIEGVDKALISSSDRKIIESNIKINNSSAVFVNEIDPNNEKINAIFFDLFSYPNLDLFSNLFSTLEKDGIMVLTGLSDSQLSPCLESLEKNSFKVIYTSWIDELSYCFISKETPNLNSKPVCAINSKEDYSSNEKLLQNKKLWQSILSPIQVEPFLINSFNSKTYDSNTFIEFSIEPTLLYGTGGNSVTQLVLSELPSQTAHLDQEEAILDIGCGTGILGIACAKLGYTHIDLMDIDEAALLEASLNCIINDINANLMNEVQSDKEYSLIISNLYGHLHFEYADYYKKSLSPNGIVLISGFDKNQKIELVPFLTKKGLKINKVISNSSSSWELLVVGHE